MKSRPRSSHIHLGSNARQMMQIKDGCCKHKTGSQEMRVEEEKCGGKERREMETEGGGRRLKCEYWQDSEDMLMVERGTGGVSLSG